MDWHAIPSLSALRAFEATARLNSFSKAARELNVTHAAIAQHVRALEAEFSETLVFRQGRGLALTQAGSALSDHLQSGFGEIAQGVEQLRNATNTRPLSISLTPAFATNWLMPRIGSFWREHPDISVNLNPSSALVDLTRDAFDMAIRFGEGTWRGLDAFLLAEGDFCVVAHPDLVKGRRATCLEDVADFPWLLEGKMRERGALLVKEGVDFETSTIKMFDTNAMVFAAVNAKLGLSVQPYALVKDQIDDGKLALVCALDRHGLGYYVVTRPGLQSQNLTTFIKWLRKQV